MKLKIEKTITEKILEELNSNLYGFKRIEGEKINLLTFEERNKEESTNIYEVRLIKNVYNESSDESIEVYWISENKKEIIDYVARRYVTNSFGYKTYSDFYKVKRRDVKVTIWEIEGDKFYEE